jgi:hypothetical protein
MHALGGALTAFSLSLFRKSSEALGYLSQNPVPGLGQVGKAWLAGFSGQQEHFHFKRFFSSKL